MSFFGRKPETKIVLYDYEVIEDPDDESTTIPDESDPDASTTSGAHCAWCGDPPDRFGSHGICASHAEQMLASRRRSRGQA